MKYSKKAESLTMQTVIVAFLVLLVLVILIFILGKNVTIFTGKSSSCLSRPGGECVNKRQGCNVLEQWSINNPSDCDEDQVCCVPIRLGDDEDSSGPRPDESPTGQIPEEYDPTTPATDRTWK